MTAVLFETSRDTLSSSIALNVSVPERIVGCIVI